MRACKGIPIKKISQSDGGGGGASIIMQDKNTESKVVHTNKEEKIVLSTLFFHTEAKINITTEETGSA